MVLNSNNCQNSISRQDSSNWTTALKNGIFVWSLHHTVSLLLVLYCLWQGFGSHSYWSASFTFHRRCFPPLPLSNYTDSLHHCVPMHLVFLPFPTFADKKQTPATFTHVWHVKRQPSWIPTLLFLSPLVRFDRDLVFAGAHLDVRF